MTFDLSLVKDMIWFVLLFGGVWFAIVMTWDWISGKLMEKRVERHATQRWLERCRKEDDQ